MKLKNPFLKNLSFISIIVLTFFILTIGLNWGRVESWNPDERSFWPETFTSLKYLFNIENYIKPPFHTYVVNFLIIRPLKHINEFLSLSEKEFAQYQLISPRLFNVFLFFSSIVLFLTISRKFVSKTISQWFSILFLTIAGLHVHVRFLTVDIHSMFWSMAYLFPFSLYVSNQKNKYLWLSAFFIGIATATKYNALSLIIVPFTYIILNSYSKNKNLLLYIKKILIKSISITTFVTLGFIVGAPSIIFDTKHMINDFVFNFLVTPASHGGYSINSYFKIFYVFSELVGYPVVLATIFCILLGLFNIKHKKKKKKDIKDEYNKQVLQLSWYSKDRLIYRKPDFVTFDNWSYKTYDQPEVKKYYEDLIRNKIPDYQVVFNENDKKIPQWIYPQNINFVESQIVVSKRIF